MSRKRNPIPEKYCADCPHHEAVHTGADGACTGRDCGCKRFRPRPR